MFTSPSRRVGSRPSATTRSQIRPTVSQPTRDRRVIMVLSVLVAKYATRSSKLRVNPERVRANGMASTRTPCCEHARRRQRARTSTCQRPKSRCRQVEVTGRVSYRARVLNGHNGPTSRRRRNATSTLTALVPTNDTSTTVMPDRPNKGVKCRGDAHGCGVLQPRLVLADLPKLEPQPVRVTQLCLRVANPRHHQHLHRYPTPTSPTLMPGEPQMLPDTALVTQRRERSHLTLVRRFQKRTRGADCTHRFRRGHEPVRGSGTVSYTHL